ncbi:hypothetical protein [Dendronalium sp. ChiSLP03b]|nr:hypothetical protein [Dendronalium sp. ChiSLP03b]MDZ8204116.1 hypothetical protein [Dendronalium sp. ChiSLP03b]
MNQKYHVIIQPAAIALTTLSFHLKTRNFKFKGRAIALTTPSFHLRT